MLSKDMVSEDELAFYSDECGWYTEISANVIHVRSRMDGFDGSEETRICDI